MTEQALYPINQPKPKPNKMNTSKKAAFFAYCVNWEKKDWGISTITDTEADALLLAYHYYSTSGTRRPEIEPTTCGRFLVTIFRA
jgi:hypothetical protein